MKTIPPWRRNLWGVLFSSVATEPFLIGESWHAVRPMSYPGEPARALVFWTRRRAREWCRLESQRVFIAIRGKFTPVRVRETLQVVK